jgi:hypothetical protein
MGTWNQFEVPTAPWNVVPPFWRSPRASLQLTPLTGLISPGNSAGMKAMPGDQLACVAMVLFLQI